TTFTYTCICPNGTVPDCTAFMNTLPYFICQETSIQCLENKAQDAQGLSECDQLSAQCGKRNATAEALAEGLLLMSSASSSPTGSTRESSASANSPTSVPSATSQPGSTSLSTGAVAGIGVGCGVGGLLLAALGFFAWWRHRHHRRDHASSSASANKRRIDGGSESVGDKAELQAHLTQETPPAMGEEPFRKSELATNANRHELDYSVSANQPWSRSEAELEA
ncbi:hypothetical protein LTR40_009020, partial [Exophiala xenobiotica]